MYNRSADRSGYGALCKRARTKVCTGELGTDETTGATPPDENQPPHEHNMTSSGYGASRRRARVVTRSYGLHTQNLWLRGATFFIAAQTVKKRRVNNKRHRRASWGHLMVTKCGGTGDARCSTDPG